MAEKERKIEIHGAKVNNLKNVDVDIPINKFTVITGLSGSGKSSLAFDTLYAEGQRRYVESLSSYARQFLGRLPKPECDSIENLPPAIAIEQRVSSRNSRSTVGTSTEIYDYLRMLFARIGKTYSPISGALVKKHTSEDVLRAIHSYKEGTRFAILSELQIPEGRSFGTHLDILKNGGYSRLEHNGEFVQIASLIAAADSLCASEYRLLIDRMTVSNSKEDDMRLRDSLATAFYEGNDECLLMVWEDAAPTVQRFSKRFEADGITFVEPTDMTFNFNNPLGACPTCNGSGHTEGIDESLVIPDKTLSVYAGAVMCWRGDVMSQWKMAFAAGASAANFPIHRPYCDLTEEEIDYLWNGSEASVNAFFDMLRKSAYKIQNRTMLARFRGETVCPQCRGNRLKKEAEYVKVGGLSITDIVRMPVEKVLEFFRQLTLSEEDATIAKRPLEEICSRLQFMCDVGLSYLTLNRLSSTLSGGESQRINLAKSLGSTLVGSVYILDEPSIGLHSRDTSRLLKVLRMLQRLDNTVVVVEHDEEIIKEADYLIDIGPAAGRKGGEVVFAGNYSTIDQAQNSLTANYLLGKNKIPVPTVRRKSSIYIEVLGARENNLKNIDVRFPLNVMTVVTGVSGSGKSTLVTNILYRALTRHFMGNDGAPGTHKGLGGDLRLLHGVQLVDQSSIVKNRSSNPAIYIKAFAEIRKLYADQQLSKQMGYREGFFSFNSEGGCEECGGQGHIEVQMQFMADLVLECESCHGKRYNKSALEVEYRGKNISDVLNMTVNQAIEFFSESNGTTERRIVKRLQPLQDVGLGYIMLGQSSATLSGGENQRLKLAYYLSMESDEPTMFIFDEPTTGLHFHDINTLLKAFYRLIEHGHTVVIIEHNMDVIKCADHIIDMGPEGGSAGGNVVVCGTPEQVSECEESFTGRWLRSKLL